MHHFNLLILVLLLAPSVWAVSSPCSLAEQEIPSDLNMTAEDINIYKQRLGVECWWKKTNDILTYELAKHNIRAESITEYQAMRFIRREDFDSSKKHEIPVEVTYQIKRDQYALPIDQRSSIIWDNWVKGISQLSPLREAILRGEHYTYDKLKQSHIKFFQLSDEVGDASNPPDVGVIKPPAMQDNYWWSFSTDQEASDAKKMVDAINGHYKSLELLPHFADENLNKVLDVRTAVKRQPKGSSTIEYVSAIYSGNTRANLTHVQNILHFVRTMLTQALNNKVLIWNGKLMTPAEVAYLAQKFYVGVHPFSEGNGRTSRLLQELILTSMGLPHGSSGDLMESDVLTLFPDYYNQAMKANINLMEKMKTCLEIYKTNPPSLLVTTDQKNIDYSCRILKSKN